MMRRRLALVALLAVFGLLVAACGDDAATTTTAAVTTTEATTTTAAPTTTEAPTTTAGPTTTLPEAISVCQVSDTGGIDDLSFNQTAWKGAQDAVAQYGEGRVSISFLESADLSDFRPNIDSFISQGCNLIVTVGFLLANDTGAAAVANPDQLFAIVDYPVGDFPPWCAGEVDPGADGTAGTFDDTCGGNVVQNVRGLTYKTDEAAFLAGYLAAGMTTTGIVGTYGGMNIPTVTIFMNGFVQGVDYYNAQKGTSVAALGWDIATQDGLFTNDFENVETGRTFTQNLVDEGADIILPVAGPVGAGTAAYCSETQSCLEIGVDTDQYVLFEPQGYGPIFLTSVMKGLDTAVLNTIVNVIELGSLGNQYSGTLANGGVGIAPYHELESAVPAELAAEVEALRLAIIAAGDLATFLAPPSE